LTLGGLAREQFFDLEFGRDDRAVALVTDPCSQRADAINGIKFKKVSR
jgi:hypothetical protein